MFGVLEMIYVLGALLAWCVGIIDSSSRADHVRATVGGLWFGVAGILFLQLNISELFNALIVYAYMFIVACLAYPILVDILACFRGEVKETV